MIWFLIYISANALFSINGLVKNGVSIYSGRPEGSHQSDGFRVFATIFLMLLAIPFAILYKINEIVK